jgi:hypothetical protein
MRLKVGRYLWHPVSRHVVRSRDANALTRANAARLERTVLERANANRYIHALFDQIDKAIAYLQIQLHLRVTIQKCLHAREQVRAPEKRGTGYTQHAAGFLQAANI